MATFVISESTVEPRKDAAAACARSEQRRPHWVRLAGWTGAVAFCAMVWTGVFVLAARLFLS